MEIFLENRRLQTSDLPDLNNNGIKLFKIKNGAKIENLMINLTTIRIITAVERIRDLKYRSEEVILYAVMQRIHNEKYGWEDD